MPLHHVLHEIVGSGSLILIVVPHRLFRLLTNSNLLVRILVDKLLQWFDDGFVVRLGKEYDGVPLLVEAADNAMSGGAEMPTWPSMCCVGGRMPARLVVPSRAAHVVRVWCCAVPPR